MQPNRVSYLMWSLAPLVAFFAQMKEGVGISALLTLSVGLIPFSIFIATFFAKATPWKLTSFDFICGLLSLIGLIIYIFTQVGEIAILFSILADGLAAIPTIKKSFYFPETESGMTYLAGLISVIITMLTYTTWSFTTTGFSVYLFVAYFVIFVLVQCKLGKKITGILRVK